jgi:hypothetical protein
MCTADGRMFGSVAEALRMANATMDYLNGPGAGDLDAASCGSVLRQDRHKHHHDHHVHRGHRDSGRIHHNQQRGLAQIAAQLGEHGPQAAG